jgi:EAL domain-containing protein (putative c-di-GMP-specific phosphodiesterase class I)
MDFLAIHDCDIMQGYLFSKPIEAGELSDMLAAQRSPALCGSDDG